MNADQALQLRIGLYRLHWKEGGSSLASVGMTFDGTRWFAPCNWTTSEKDKPFVAHTKWSIVEHAEHLDIPFEVSDDVYAKAANVDKAVERLVFMMHIYQGYPVGKSRGPNGCVWEAIKALAPDIAAEVEATSWDAVYDKHWGEVDEETIVPATATEVLAAVGQRDENRVMMRGDFGEFAMALRDELQDVVTKDGDKAVIRMLRIVYDCARAVAAK